MTVRAGALFAVCVAAVLLVLALVGRNGQVTLAPIAHRRLFGVMDIAEDVGSSSYSSPDSASYSSTDPTADSAAYAATEAASDAASDAASYAAGDAADAAEGSDAISGNDAVSGNDATSGSSDAAENDTVSTDAESSSEYSSPNDEASGPDTSENTYGSSTDASGDSGDLGGDGSSSSGGGGLDSEINNLQKVFKQAQSVIKQVKKVQALVAKVKGLIQTINPKSKVTKPSALKNSVQQLGKDNSAAVTTTAVPGNEIINLSDVAASFAPLNTVVARTIVTKPRPINAKTDPKGALVNYVRLPSVQDVTASMWIMLKNPTDKSAADLMAETDAPVEIGVLISKALVRILLKVALDTIGSSCKIYNSCGSGYWALSNYLAYDCHTRLRDARRAEDVFTFSLFETEPLPNAKQAKKGPAANPSGFGFKGLALQFMGTLDINMLAAFSMGTISTSDAVFAIMQDALSRPGLIAVALTDAAKELVAAGYINAAGATVKAHTALVAAVAKGSAVIGSGVGNNWLFTEKPYPPTLPPSARPTRAPTLPPTYKPTLRPTFKPTNPPRAPPSPVPTKAPTIPRSKPPTPKPSSIKAPPKPAAKPIKKPTRN